MPAVTRNEKADNKLTRDFIGKAWNNTSKVKGIPYIRLTLDSNVSEVVLTPKTRLELWPNKKREGKQDADFRLTIAE